VEKVRKAKPVDPARYAGPNAKVPFLAPDVLTKVIPAPVEGWDAISPLAEMDPKRAPILQNWVPRPGYVELRGGYVAFAGAGNVAPVETLMVFRPPVGGQQMFAAASTEIYNVSGGGGGIPVFGGQTSARWQWTNFESGGGVNVIQAGNGHDPVIQYDGTNWTNPGITGLPAGNILGVFATKQRLWYITANSTLVSFLPTGAITGAIAGTQDFGTLWNKGGALISMAEWTIDGGSGPQSYVMFLSSQGQVSLYQGIDPTNPNAWSLVGTFTLSPPIGNRPLLQTGSDVAIITQQGVIPISQALPFDPSSDRSVAVTARIQNAMAQAALLGQNEFGWELITFPNQQLFILNVPIAENELQSQYVMNTLTGAWCSFVGWNANTFTIFNNNLYFGGNDGEINQAYIGGADLTIPIQADMQCAFNWLDEPGKTKRMTMVQPLLTLTGTLIPTMAIDVDFVSSTASAPVTTSLVGTVLWDVAMWDQSQWPPLTISFNQFLSVEALGHAMAIRMRVNIASGTGSGLDVNSEFDVAQFDTGVFGAVSNPNIPVVQVNAFNAIAELGGAL
jgi:hypothetical protein